MLPKPLLEKFVTESAFYWLINILKFTETCCKVSINFSAFCLENQGKKEKKNKNVTNSGKQEGKKDVFLRGNGAKSTKSP